MRKYTKRLPPITLTCPQCGKEFVRYAYYVRLKRKRNSTGNIYCSAECARQFRWGKPRTLTVRCRQCNKEFERQLASVKGGSTYGPFCSHKCYGKWRSENLVGESATAWKGGHTLPLGDWYWKHQRDKARERDNYTCQDCGATEENLGYTLDVHHKIPYDFFEDSEAAHHLDNLISLCRACHMAKHKLETTA